MQGGKALRSLAVTPVEMTKLSTAKAVQSQPSGQTTGPIPGHQWEERCQALWSRMQGGGSFIFIKARAGRAAVITRPQRSPS